MPDDTTPGDLRDHAAITDLLNRFLLSLDDRVADPARFDDAWARAFFTADVSAEMPIGTVRGRDAVTARIREGMSRFDRTVHMASGAVVEIDGDRATARGPQLSTHILAGGSDGDLFVSAGHSTSDLVRTPDGWRIAATALRIVWTQGTPPHVPPPTP
ncbi:nuclear transport factor 2 family protein [Streptomyces avicenniae]|uniref:nuclear transport factor 2 family protein n=1 Tax=Streptomyces avicenniae TaxID=500153 RepID=UPI00069C3E4C|nr:nuclear transport factor 2 family protein [Streptomyces avicenniae]